MLSHPRDKKIQIFDNHVIKGDIRDQPPQRFPRHMSLMKYAVVNCDKIVVNHG